LPSALLAFQRKGSAATLVLAGRGFLLSAEKGPVKLAILWMPPCGASQREHRRFQMETSFPHLAGARLGCYSSSSRGQEGSYRRRTLYGSLPLGNHIALEVACSSVSRWHRITRALGLSSYWKSAEERRLRLVESYPLGWVEVRAEARVVLAPGRRRGALVAVRLSRRGARLSWTLKGAAVASPRAVLLATPGLGSRGFWRWLSGSSMEADLRCRLALPRGYHLAWACRLTPEGCTYQLFSLRARWDI